MSDLESSNWSETAGSNNAAPPDGWPEGMLPSGVNNAAREMMRALKSDWNRSHTTLASSGSANAYVLTYTVAPAAYVNGQRFSFRANFSNTGSATANVNSLGAKTINKQTSSGFAVLSSGDIVSTQHCILEYDSTSDVLVLLNPQYTSAATAFFNITPQGRLTLQSATPVMTADQTAKTTVYYDTYTGSKVPIAGALYDITSNELSLVLDTSNHLSGNLYDIFAIVNAGAAKLVTGPAWTNSTTRSAALAISNGVWTNSGSLTHAYNNSTDYGTVSANAGTYLGTLYATANGQTGCAFKPAAAGGGSNAILGLYNAYNRVVAASMSRDNTASWTYSTTSWRAANNSTSNRVSYVDGLGTSPVRAFHSGLWTPSANTAIIGMNFDATTSTPDVGIQGIGTAGSALFCTQGFAPSLGFHYVQAVEYATGATQTFYGANAGQQQQMLGIEVWM